MPRLIEEDKAIEVLTDYYHIHTTIQQMAMEEAFSRIPTVEAIPVEWLEKQADEYIELGLNSVAKELRVIIDEWEKENGRNQ